MALSLRDEPTPPNRKQKEETWNGSSDLHPEP